MMTTLLTLRVVCVLMGDEAVMMQLLDVAVALSLFKRRQPKQQAKQATTRKDETTTPQQRVISN